MRGTDSISLLKNKFENKMKEEISWHCPTKAPEGLVPGGEARHFWENAKNTWPSSTNANTGENNQREKPDH